MYFEINNIALILALVAACVFYLLFIWGRRFALPQLYFSDLKDLVPKNLGLKRRLASLPNQLNMAALIFFILAFIDPHLFVSKKPEKEAPQPPGEPTEGIAIYLLLDQSGSMSESVNALSSSGYVTKIPKIDLLKNVTKEFIVGNPSLDLGGRPNDLIGMVTFARAAHVRVPLTLDHSLILKELSHLHVVTKSDEDGTSMGYAIFKTANLIVETRHFAENLIAKGKPAYQIKSSVIILVTDGFEDPNLQDFGNPLRTMDPYEAAKFAKQNGIKLYVVNVDPSLNTQEYAPQRHLMERSAALTGGKFFIVGSISNLADIYSEIDSLEKSKLPEEAQAKAVIPKSEQPQLYRRISFYPYLIALGMLCLFISIVLSATFLRRFP